MFNSTVRNLGGVSNELKAMQTSTKKILDQVKGITKEFEKWKSLHPGAITGSGQLSPAAANNGGGSPQRGFSGVTTPDLKKWGLQGAPSSVTRALASVGASSMSMPGKQATPVDNGAPKSPGAASITMPSAPIVGGGGGAGAPPPPHGGSGASFGGASGSALANVLSGVPGVTGAAKQVAVTGMALLPDAQRGIVMREDAYFSAMRGRGTPRDFARNRTIMSQADVMGTRILSATDQQSVIRAAVDQNMGTTTSDLKNVGQFAGWATQMMGMDPTQAASSVGQMYTPDAANTLRNYYGISVTDSQGNRRPVQDIAKDLYQRIVVPNRVYQGPNGADELVKAIQAKAVDLSFLGDMAAPVQQALLEQMGQKQLQDTGQLSKSSQWNMNANSDYANATGANNTATASVGREATAQASYDNAGADAAAQGFKGVTEASGAVTSAFEDLYKAMGPFGSALQMINGGLTGFQGSETLNKTMNFGKSVWGLVSQTAQMFGMAGLSEGAWRVNRDQVAQVHQGEMIIPERDAEKVRSALKDATPKGAESMGTGDVAPGAQGSGPLSDAAGELKSAAADLQDAAKSLKESSGGGGGGSVSSASGGSGSTGGSQSIKGITGKGNAGSGGGSGTANAKGKVSTSAGVSVKGKSSTNGTLGKDQVLQAFLSAAGAGTAGSSGGLLAGNADVIGANTRLGASASGKPKSSSSSSSSSSSLPAGTLPDGASGADQAATKKAMYGYLKSQGYSDAGIAGIMGNVQQESSFSTSVINGIGAAGLFQWYQGRRDALNEYAKATNTQWTDLKTQLDFFSREMERGYPNLISFLKSTNSPEEAAAEFEGQFEKGGDVPIRQTYARQLYDQITHGGFSEGSWRVPRDQIAQIHQGEMILPEAVSQTVRQVVAEKSSGIDRSSPVQLKVDVTLLNATEEEGRRLTNIVRAELESAMLESSLVAT